VLTYSGTTGTSWLDEHHVIGQVELSGRITNPPDREDPPSTHRASYGQATGLLYVPGPLWDESVDLLRRRHPGPDVRHVPSLDVLRDLAPGDPLPEHVPPRSTDSDDAPAQLAHS
jgi:hypothetical protein